MLSFLIDGQGSNPKLRLATKLIKIKNTTEQVKNLNISISGDSFLLALNRCGATLSPGKSCELRIAFSAGNKLNNTYTGILQITDTGVIPLSAVVNVADNVPVVSDGLVTDLEVSMPQPFSSSTSSFVPTRRINILNPTNKEITNISFNVNNKYGILINKCPSSLKPKQSCFIIVFYKDIKNLPNPSESSLIVNQDSLSKALNLLGTVIPEVYIPTYSDYSPLNPVLNACDGVVTSNRTIISCKRQSDNQMVLNSFCSDDTPSISYSSPEGFSITNISNGTRNDFCLAGSSIRVPGTITCSPTYVEYNGECVKPKYHVFLIAGQSNSMAIVQNSINSASSCSELDSDARILQYSRGINVGGLCPYSAGSAGSVIPASDPLQHLEVATNFLTNKVAPSFGMRFAKKYLDTIPSIDKVILVPAGVNGTSFYAGDWIRTGTRYLDAVNRTNQVLSLYGADVSLKGVLFQHGESDSTTSSIISNQYEKHLSDFISNIRTDITGASSSPVLIGGMGPSFIANALYFGPIVSSSQQKMQYYHTNVAYVDSTGLVLQDTYHYNSNSQKTLGDRYFNAFINNLNAVKLFYPISNISLSGNKASANQPAVTVGTLSSSGGVQPHTYTTNTPGFSILNDRLIITNVAPGTHSVSITSTDTIGTAFTKNIDVVVTNPVVSNDSATGFTDGYGVASSSTATSYFDFEASWSMNFIIKPSASNFNGIVFDTQLPNTGSSRLRGVRVSGNSGQIQVWIISDYPVLYNLFATYDKLPIDTWTKVTVTYDSSLTPRNRVKIYFNGALATAVASGSTSGTFILNHDQQKYIGISFGTNSLDELSLWNTTLSATDVLALSNNIDASVHSKSAFLQHRYKMESSTDSGNTLNDSGLNPVPMLKKNAAKSDLIFINSSVGQ